MDLLTQLANYLLQTTQKNTEYYTDAYFTYAHNLRDDEEEA